MRKNIAKNLIISIFSLLMLLPAFTVSASAAENRARGWSGDSSSSLFLDSADIFSSREEAELTKAVQNTSEKLELNILIIAAGTEQRMSDDETEKYCNRVYDDFFGPDSDGVLLFMDFSGKAPAYDYISTSGRARLDYDRHINDIMDSYMELMPPSTVKDYRSYSDDIAKSVGTFLSCLEDYHGSGNKRIIYDDRTGVYIFFMNGRTVITPSKPLAPKLRGMIAATFLLTLTGGAS